MGREKWRTNSKERDSETNEPIIAREMWRHNTACGAGRQSLALPNMPFGQLVVGPPGSGKTTYCRGMYEFLTGIGRKVAVINLDPANDNLPYECAINIADFITVKQVAEEQQMGPNGAMVYCIEQVDRNFDTYFASKFASIDKGSTRREILYSEKSAVLTFFLLQIHRCSLTARVR